MRGQKDKTEINVVSLAYTVDDARAHRATRQDFGMHHKIIGGLEVEEIDGAEDSIVSRARDFTSQATVALKP